MSLLKLLFPTVVASIILFNTYNFVRRMVMMITCHTLNISRVCCSSRQQAVRLAPLIVKLHFTESNNNMNFFLVWNIFYHHSECKHKPLNLVGSEVKHFGNVKSLTEWKCENFLSLLFCGFLVISCVSLKCSEVQLSKKSDLCYSVWRLLGNMGVHQAFPV